MAEGGSAKEEAGEERRTSVVWLQRRTADWEWVPSAPVPREEEARDCAKGQWQHEQSSNADRPSFARSTGVSVSDMSVGGDDDFASLRAIIRFSERRRVSVENSGPSLHDWLLRGAGLQPERAQMLSQGLMRKSGIASVETLADLSLQLISSEERDLGTSAALEEMLLLCGCEHEDLTSVKQSMATWLIEHIEGRGWWEVSTVPSGAGGEPAAAVTRRSVPRGRARSRSSSSSGGGGGGRPSAVGEEILRAVRRLTVDAPREGAFAPGGSPRDGSVPDASEDVRVLHALLREKALWAWRVAEAGGSRSRRLRSIALVEDGAGCWLQWQKGNQMTDTFHLSTLEIVHVDSGCPGALTLITAEGDILRLEVPVPQAVLKMRADRRRRLSADLDVAARAAGMALPVRRTHAWSSTAEDSGKVIEDGGVGAFNAEDVQRRELRDRLVRGFRALKAHFDAQRSFRNYTEGIADGFAGGGGAAAGGGEQVPSSRGAAQKSRFSRKLSQRILEDKRRAGAAAPPSDVSEFGSSGCPTVNLEDYGVGALAELEASDEDGDEESSAGEGAGAFPGASEPHFLTIADTMDSDLVPPPRPDSSPPASSVSSQSLSATPPRIIARRRLTDAPPRNIRRKSMQPEIFDADGNVLQPVGRRRMTVAGAAPPPPPPLGPDGPFRAPPGLKRGSMPPGL